MATISGKEEEQGKVLIYCLSEFCQGMPIDVEPSDDGCPICYDSDFVKMVRISPCKHIFCVECFEQGLMKNEKRECFMCRTMFKSYVNISRPIPVNFETPIADHTRCFYRSDPVVDSHLAGFSDAWMKLVQFILTVHTLDTRYPDVHGVKDLNMDCYKDKEKLISRGRNYAVVKTENDKLMVVFACSLPYLSIRLVVSKRTDIDFEIDNEYADNVIGYMNSQIDACWTSLGELMNKCYLERLYVREFGDNVATLLLHVKRSDDRLVHYQPMKAQLSRLKRFNFDPVHKPIFRKEIPSLNYSGAMKTCEKLKRSYFSTYGKYYCCGDYTLWLKKMNNNIPVDKTKYVNYVVRDDESFANEVEHIRMPWWT